MSRALRHMRHVKRGTPHVHSCPTCSRWRVNPTVCTNPKCDIVGVHADCPSITPGQMYPLGGHCSVCAACSAEADSAWALDALRALGGAIAAIARARLIERVTAGDRVIAELGDGRAFELWPCGETLYVSGWGHDGMVELRKFRGDFEDIAAEAVAALIEECER